MLPYAVGGSQSDKVKYIFQIRLTGLTVSGNLLFMDTPHSFPTQPLPRPDACWIRLTQEDVAEEAERQNFYALLNCKNAGREHSIYYAWERT